MVEFGSKSMKNDRSSLLAKLRQSGFYNIDGSVVLRSESMRLLTRDELQEDSAQG